MAVAYTQVPLLLAIWSLTSASMAATRSLVEGRGKDSMAEAGLSKGRKSGHNCSQLIIKTDRLTHFIR